MEDVAAENRKPARIKIYELANMISVPMSLNAAVRLKVPDIIWAGGSNAPLSTAQILTEVCPSNGGDAENLQRVLYEIFTRYGVFEEHVGSSGERKYSLTDFGKTLVPDSYGLSYADYVLQHHQDELLREWPLVHEAGLDPAVEPFARANGDSAYSYYTKKPEMNGLMQRAMSGMSVPFMTALLDSGCDGFSGMKRLVDVGGSAGDCLCMIMRKHPNVTEGINFDLPEVVAKVPRNPGVTKVGGDMFLSIPAGDAIILKWILKTWSDEECKLIMENCFKALPEGGKLIACDPVLPELSDDSHQTRALLQGDIFVMTIYRTKGKHRTEEEFQQLDRSAGFPHFRAVHIDYFYTVLEFQK